MTDLPHTYTDDSGVTLHVAEDLLVMTAPGGGDGPTEIPMLTPKGDAAVELLAALAEAAGLDDTDEGPGPCRAWTTHPHHPGAPLYCEHSSGDGHGGLHYADVAGRTRTWDGDRLPERDLVEPGDEVPDLAELHGWVERLDRDLSDTTKAVTQRLAAIEERLSPADTKATPASTPAWYQDKDGDIWGQRPDGRFAMVRSRDGRPAPYFKPRTLDALDDRYGPLTRVDDAAPAGGAE